MPVCPITLKAFEPGEGDPGVYSRDGLRRLHPRLSDLSPLTFTVEEQIQEAAARAGKMSIQGVQPKLSAILNPSRGGFEVVDRGGRFILRKGRPSVVYYQKHPAPRFAPSRGACSGRRVLRFGRCKPATVAPSPPRSPGRARCGRRSSPALRSARRCQGPRSTEWARRVPASSRECTRISMRVRSASSPRKASPR